MVYTHADTVLGRMRVSSEYMLERLSGKGGVSVYLETLEVSLLFDAEGSHVEGAGNTDLDAKSMEEITKVVRGVLNNDEVFKLAYRNESFMRDHLILFKAVREHERKLQAARLSLEDLKKAADALGLTEYIEAQENAVVQANLGR